LFIGEQGGVVGDVVAMGMDMEKQRKKNDTSDCIADDGGCQEASGRGACHTATLFTLIRRILSLSLVPLSLLQANLMRGQCRPQTRHWQSCVYARPVRTWRLLCYRNSGT
jgi:hypothetical protein